MLVVIIAWALFAVAMLTGTLVAAQKIETRVAVINDDFPTIGQNLESIPLAVETGRIADEINRVAAPIGPQFTQVVDAVGSINAAAKTVNDNVVSINGSVKMINDSVKTIAGNVSSIDTTLTAVNGQAGSINASVVGIGGSFDGILGEVRSIDVEVAGINNRADVVIGQALGISRDLDKVANDVLPDIVQNSRAIRDSPLLLNSLEELLGLPIFKDLTTPVLEDLPVPPVALPAPLGPKDGVLPPGPLLAGDKGIVPEVVPAPKVIEGGADKLLKPVGDLVAPR
ncbi:MAG: hypothetical protein ACRDRH_26315 [Pseudonocardia sp.]